MKKILWPVISCLMVLSLVLASCGPAEEEEEEVTPPPVEEEEEVTPPPEEEEEEVVPPSPDKPKYGGVLTIAWPTGPYYFDEAFGHTYFSTQNMFTNETLTMGDWTKGPTGTGEASWAHINTPRMALVVGSLAESWDISEPGKFVWYIRQGVKWHNIPPCNGRELTAEDVVFTLRRLFTSPKSQWVGVPGAYMGVGEAGRTIEDVIYQTDKYTAVMEYNADKAQLFMWVTQHMKIYAKDAVELWGDLNEWDRTIGTGPYVIKDHVRDSSITYERNPNYWMKNPMGPGEGDQLPYPDGIKYLVIPDRSTSFAAIRTGRVDWTFPVAWEDAQQLINTAPRLKYTKYVPLTAALIGGRLDKPELPFDDVRVRQALQMGVDRREILDGLYGGEGPLLNWPVSPIPEYSNIYWELEELPEDVQELFTYNPEKARQLLADAGYPNGFKTSIVCEPGSVDLLSVIKDQWEDIGVELEITPKEPGAYRSMLYGKTFPGMIYGDDNDTPFHFSRTAPGGAQFNYVNVDDPILDEAQLACYENYLDDQMKAEIYKPLVPYILRQSYYISIPFGMLYQFWQPWIKNYNGEYEVGYMACFFNWSYFIWIDQDLKEEMTGMR